LNRCWLICQCLAILLFLNELNELITHKNLTIGSRGSRKLRPSAEPLIIFTGLHTNISQNNPGGKQMLPSVPWLSWLALVIVNTIILFSLVMLNRFSGLNSPPLAA
jgi:hypothetical protein